MHQEINEMITKFVFPVERELFQHQLSADKWIPHPIIEQLKVFVDHLYHHIDQGHVYTLL